MAEKTPTKAEGSAMTMLTMRLALIARVLVRLD
jgi:hypothetical protein